MPYFGCLSSYLLKNGRCDVVCELSSVKMFAVTARFCDISDACDVDEKLSFVCFTKICHF